MMQYGEYTVKTTPDASPPSTSPTRPRLLAIATAKFNTKRLSDGYQKKLPPRMMETFKYFHRMHNKRIVWSEKLASQAVNEAITGGTKAKLKLRLPKPFKTAKGGRLKLQDKILNALTSLFNMNGNLNNVTALPLGTFYGCGGFYTKFEEIILLQIACVYN
ncbi:hypothetical protein OSTOST_11674 [Ostertagia ostertagi]